MSKRWHHRRHGGPSVQREASLIGSPSGQHQIKIEKSNLGTTGYDHRTILNGMKSTGN